MGEDGTLKRTPLEPAVLICGEWTQPPDPRIKPVLLNGCGKNAVHDYVDTRPIFGLAGVVSGYESLWKSRCCGVERRWGLSVMRRTA